MDPTLKGVKVMAVGPAERTALEERVASIEETQAKILREMETNTNFTKAILDFLRNARGFGNFLKWTAGVGAALMFLWQAFNSLRN